MPVAVLRVGLDSRHGVDHIGTVRLTEESQPTRFVGQSWPRRRVLFRVTDERDRLSVRVRKKNIEKFYFLNL